MKIDLMYFDHDHGIERLFFVQMDRETRTVQLRMEIGADATHGDEVEVESKTSQGAVACSNAAEFDSFCRRLTTAMKATPFSLQDPQKPPFNRMPHDQLVLEGLDYAVPLTPVSCKIPASIVTDLVHTDYAREKFKDLI